MSNGPENPVRSPSYPAWPLSDAVSAVRKIEAQYRNAKVDREIAAKIIGYSSLSGPANKSLAALAQYGLVERAGKGEMRVTERARAILHPNDESEKRAQLRAAALEPQLFRELQERWPAMTPPEDGVIMYLNRKGFNQTAIRPAAKAYLQTLLYIEEEVGSESHGSVAEPVPESASSLEAKAETMIDANTLERQEPLIPKPLARQIAAALDGPQLNRIDMNIQGDKVLLSGLLNLQGLDALEKKIAALRILLEVYHDANDTGESEDGG